jgi:ElaB/YqjD/DUF883 family membrane-anchored ribosome-binding protein
MAERSDLAVQRKVESEAPARSAEAIRHDIAAKRESISDTVDKLGERISETFDWREYVAEYPAIALGLAAGTGLLIAGIFRRKPTPQERILEAVAELTEDMKDRVGDAMAGIVQKRLVSSRTLRAAVTTMATKAAMDFLRTKLANTLEASRSSSTQSRSATPVH